MNHISLIILVFLVTINVAIGQSGQVSGQLQNKGNAVSFATIQLAQNNAFTRSQVQGHFKFEGVKAGLDTLKISLIGFQPLSIPIEITHSGLDLGVISMTESDDNLGPLTISGTMRPISKLDSPVPVEVYSKDFFKANPTPSLFESLQNINGVRPQLNCNVCNTGDIHINGLEGPYTMVLIDGMPIVSGLSTVYGLNGIPQSLIERVEIVKGPASTLYGSEAVGGIINVITKSAKNAPALSVDLMGSTWAEFNHDLGLKFNAGKASDVLLGVNYFKYDLPLDKNGDGFTDITLQDRLSLFNKWQFNRKDGKLLSIAGRYVYEDRWGGEMNWTPEYRGGEEVYGESIYTSRWEAYGNYEVHGLTGVNLQFSANGHQQNSVYGSMSYIANQTIGFGQLTWSETINDKHEILTGASLRYTRYDDNTVATEIVDSLGFSVNNPNGTLLPGVFVQDHIRFNLQNQLLVGLRYDYNSFHGPIWSPRINYKWNNPSKTTIFRVSAGNGYRVANVFTEDHAALTGARSVVFADQLAPETSWNGNVNLVKKWFIGKKHYLGLDLTAFYTHFNNRIIADYDTDPNKIIYDNLDGFAVSKGITTNLDLALDNGLKITAGATIMEVFSEEQGQRQQQILTERVSGVWGISYHFNKLGLNMDYTGNLYGPMRLPILGPLDPRPEYSPWWSIQNIKLSKNLGTQWTIYLGIKNLLNYTPPANSIARAFDPFDKGVTFDANGNVVASANNPNALSFDPSYVFAPNQGIRAFFGVRFTMR